MKQSLSLKILVCLAGIAFGFMIISSFIKEYEDIEMGFNMGVAEYHSDKNTGQSDISNKIANVMPLEVYFLTLKPKESVFSFPDSILNLKTNNEISTRYFRTKASLPYFRVVPKKVKIYDRISIPITFLIAATYIFLFFNMYFLLSSLGKEIVFDRKNIIQLRKIGISLLLIFLLMTVFNYLSFLSNTILFEFEHYTIVSDKADTINLFLGIVILLIAEIISRGFKLKQENELTI